MPLLYSTLEALRRRLDRLLQGEDPQPEPLVVLSNLASPDGPEGAGLRDRLVLSLAGLHHDTTTAAPNHVERRAGALAPPPPMRLNLTLLVTANFGDAHYGAGLAVLSNTIAFLQAHPVFTRESLPGLEPAVEKLAVDFLNLDLGQTNSLFGAKGARYMPCAAYRLRSLTFARALEDTPLVLEPVLKARARGGGGHPSTAERIPHQSGDEAKPRR